MTAQKGRCLIVQGIETGIAPLVTHVQAKASFDVELAEEYIVCGSLSYAAFRIGEI